MKWMRIIFSIWNSWSKCLRISPFLIRLSYPPLQRKKKISIKSNKFWRKYNFLLLLFDSRQSTSRSRSKSISKKKKHSRKHSQKHSRKHHRKQSHNSRKNRFSSQSRDDSSRKIPSSSSRHRRKKKDNKYKKKKLNKPNISFLNLSLDSKIDLAQIQLDPDPDTNPNIKS